MGRAPDGPDLNIFILVGWNWSLLSVAWPTGVLLVFFFCSTSSVMLFGAQGSVAGQLIISASPRISFIMDVIMVYLFALDDSLTS